MCWVAWDSLTRPKYARGLGFRDVEQFNDALLAKISWRLLSQPESLLAKVLLGKYCHSSSFLDCSSSPNSASHGWRSILIGRDLLKKGLGWSVGTGDSINLWTDPWLSLTQPKRPFGPPPAEAVDLTVEDLLCSATNEWNTTAIRSLLPQYEDDIRNLITSFNPLKDSLVWLPEASGSYSSKTGYALLQKSTEKTNGSSFDWHKHIWQLHLSPKLKDFLWKVTAGALSVGSNLTKRGMTSAAACKRCGHVENEVHLFTQCDFADKVWNLAPFASPPVLTDLSSPQLLLEASSRLVCLPPSGITLTPLAPWLLWNIWKARNKLLFEDRTFSPSEVIHKAISEARDWQEAQIAVPKSNTVHRNPLPLSDFSGYHCCYVDAAWNSTSGVCGMGWLLKDQDGVFVTQASDSRTYVPSALVAEALAMRAALLHISSIAHLSQIRSIVIFSDSQVLIKLLNSKGSIKELKGILHDIHCSRRAFSSISFAFISRSNNMEADSLAKAALSSISVVNPSSIVGG